MTVEEKPQFFSVQKPSVPHIGVELFLFREKDINCLLSKFLSF